MAIGGILLGTHYDVLQPTTVDVGWFLVVFTLITTIFFVGAMRTSSAHALLFLTRLLGFIFLDISHRGGPAMSVFNIVAAIDLVICALVAWCIMAHIILTPLNVRVPLGRPWVRQRPAHGHLTIVERRVYRTQHYAPPDVVAAAEPGAMHSSCNSAML